MRRTQEEKYRDAKAAAVWAVEEAAGRREADERHFVAGLNGSIRFLIGDEVANGCGGYDVTIVDTTRPDMVARAFEVVCYCPDMDDAETIILALNMAYPKHSALAKERGS